MATIYDMAAVVTLYFICSIFLCNNSVKAGPDIIFYADLIRVSINNKYKLLN